MGSEVPTSLKRQVGPLESVLDLDDEIKVGAVGPVEDRRNGRRVPRHQDLILLRSHVKVRGAFRGLPFLHCRKPRRLDGAGCCLRSGFVYVPSWVWHIFTKLLRCRHYYDP